MTAAIAGWVLAVLIYFKAAFDAAFYDGISIVAALLLAVLFGVEVFAASSVYAIRLLRYNWTPGAVPARLSTLLAKTALPAVGMAVLYSL
jgi:hypothetical protein